MRVQKGGLLSRGDRGEPRGGDRLRGDVRNQSVGSDGDASVKTQGGVNLASQPCSAVDHRSEEAGRPPHVQEEGSVFRHRHARTIAAGDCINRFPSAKKGAVIRLDDQQGGKDQLGVSKAHANADSFLSGDRRGAEDQRPGGRSPGDDERNGFQGRIPDDRCARAEIADRKMDDHRRVLSAWAFLTACPRWWLLKYTAIRLASSANAVIRRAIESSSPVL